MRVRATVGFMALGLVVGLLPPPAVATDGSFSASLSIRPGKGKLDETTQKGWLKIRNWKLRVETGSDGVDPATDAITLSIGSGAKTTAYVVPVGAMEPSKNGRKFRYRSEAAEDIQSLTMKRRKDGTWKLTMKVTGIIMERLSVQTSVCEFLSLEVGNDEAFIGINMRRPKPGSKGEARRLLRARHLCRRATHRTRHRRTRHGPAQRLPHLIAALHQATS